MTRWPWKAEDYAATSQKCYPSPIGQQKPFVPPSSSFWRGWIACLTRFIRCPHSGAFTLRLCAPGMSSRWSLALHHLCFCIHWWSSAGLISAITSLRCDGQLPLLCFVVVLGFPLSHYDFKKKLNKWWTKCCKVKSMPRNIISCFCVHTMSLLMFVKYFYNTLMQYT